MNLLKKVVLTLLVIFFLTSLTRNLTEYRKNLTFYRSFKKQYEEEKKRNISLKTQALKKSDPNEIEKTIRNKLNLARPNEITIMIQDPTPTPKLIITPQLPPYQQWYAVFFK